MVITFCAPMLWHHTRYKQSSVEFQINQIGRCQSK